jgi:hypothetical protein
MRTLILIAGLLLTVPVQSQEIYKWVDKDGVVHYSDQPGSPDAKKVIIAAPNSYQGPAATAAPAPSRQGNGSQQEPAAPPYGSLRILSPTSKDSYFGADATVPVTLALDGELQDGHSIVLFLDAARVKDFQGLSGQLTGLSRGMHFVRAAVLNEAGKPLVTSEQVTFSVQQPSIAKPPVGPALRPPTPKPMPK